MATLTIHLSGEKYERLCKLAESRQISVGKLIDEISTIALTEFDAETRFHARVALGSREESLRLLDILDREV